MTADRDPDAMTPEPAMPEVPESAGSAAPPVPPSPDAATEATTEAAVGAAGLDLPVTEPLTPDPSPLLPDVVPVMPVTDSPTTDVPTTGRRKRVALGFWRLGRPVMSLGLLAIGIALGATAFGAVQPKDPAIVAENPSSVLPPAAVREFIMALAANDADALRAAVPADPYRLLAGELETRGYQEITSVDTLGTILDGDRSATEIVIHGSASGGLLRVINLVVHAQNGVIVSFR